MSLTSQSRDLTADLISGIEQGLDDLVESSDHVRKKDWLLMLYGVAFGMIVNDAVPPRFVQSIITTVITDLGQIFRLGDVPMPVPPPA